jgi:hypothetical protein
LNWLRAQSKYSSHNTHLHLRLPFYVNEINESTFKTKII